ncbi:MAG: Glu/Leu/Phe/Val dehydrogenase [Chloroflexi bacterium]|nr:Glu/Leu/Phe/Val dehydrogenase [Chloroflexota bacterium]
MKIIDYMERYGYEQLTFCSDPASGLRAMVAIHDTTLGPALGGARMFPYPDEEAAITDVLRLARAMTYKAAAAGLNLGGGKAVIWGDPAKDKSEALFRAFGRYLEALGGRYITTEDVGTTTRDMEWISAETAHVTGLPVPLGGSGDPSPATAMGVWRGMKACAAAVWGADSLKGRHVALMGLGKVGAALARHLHGDGARLTVADVNPAALKAAASLGASVVSPQDITSVECDIFAPCALGAVLNDDTIPRLKCRVVAGAANNQLAEERHGDALAQRGILYAPDYVLNGGGLINLSFEPEALKSTGVVTGYNAEAARAKVEGIYGTIERIIALAREGGIPTAQAADKLVEARLASARRVRRLYLE